VATGAIYRPWASLSRSPGGEDGKEGGKWEWEANEGHDEGEDQLGGGCDMAGKEDEKKDNEG
jgi:hypothetical protein